MNTTKRTPAQIEASRKNGAKSRGPRTEESKARSRLNALKHGMRSETVVLATEDVQAFAARKAYWIDYYKPESPAAPRLRLSTTGTTQMPRHYR